MKSRPFHVVAAFATFILMLCGLFACSINPVGSSTQTAPPVTDPDVVVDNQDTDTNLVVLPPAISEAQAMQIAMTGLDPTIYHPTSTITGPMTADQGVEIEAYEVTINGGDKLVLRYVNDATGELLADQDAWHDVPAISEMDTAVDTGAVVPFSYYTSCPAGWPLCIKSNPATITFYSQNDPNWKNHTLGYGPSTIGSAGCLLSTYAMAICQNHGTCVNSDTLNTAGKNGGCFVGDLLTLSGGVHSCITNVEGASNTKIGVNDVWSTLQSGKAVIAFGTSDCFRGSPTHAQMIWGHDGSRYWTKDPWYDWANQDQSLCLRSITYYKVQ